VRRDTDGAGNFFAPAGIAEEVLTEPLSRHGVSLKSVAAEGGRTREKSMLVSFPLFWSNDSPRMRREHGESIFEGICLN
jgi:hypothetical protein